MFEDAISILRSLKASGNYKDIKGMDDAFDFGIAIIQDGMGSIYSDDYAPGYAEHVCTRRVEAGMDFHHQIPAGTTAQITKLL